MEVRRVCRSHPANRTPLTEAVEAAFLFSPSFAACASLEVLDMCLTERDLKVSIYQRLLVLTNPVVQFIRRGVQKFGNLLTSISCTCLPRPALVWSRGQ